MKLTRKELNILIESYLSDSLKEDMSRKSVELTVHMPECNFKPDPEFLKIIDFIKTGKRPSGYVGADQGKPDLFNPLFLEAITGQLLPFVNMLVVPQIGLETKCNTLREMQALFNSMYSEFVSGFEGQSPHKELTPEELEAKESEINADLEKLYQQYFDPQLFPYLMERNNILPTKERNPNYLKPDADIPAGLTRWELYYATLILGDLTKAKSENDSAVGRIVYDFQSAERVSSAKDLFLLTKHSASIPGYDKTTLSTLFSASVANFRNPENGADNMLKLTLKLFDKLKLANLID